MHGLAEVYSGERRSDPKETSQARQRQIFKSASRRKHCDLVFGSVITH